MPIDHPLTNNYPFPYDINVSIKEFMSWPEERSQHRIMHGQHEGYPYYLIRFSALNPAGNTYRLTICPQASESSCRDIECNIARVYDVTDLFRRLFPNAETHPIIHQHETGLYLPRNLRRKPV